MGKLGIRYTNEFKHEVCQFYEHHSQIETCAKYGISNKSLWEWRTKLGYVNKHKGYNNHTEKLQPAAKVTRRQHRNFAITKAENGQLQGELMEVKLQYAVLEREFKQLKDTIMEALQ